MRLSACFVGALRLLAMTGMLYSCAITAFAAESVTAEARALKQKVRVGDEIPLFIRVDHPRKYAVTPPEAKTDLRPFEIKRVDPAPVRKGQNRVQQTFGLTLTVFQTGDLEIPAIPVRFTDEDGAPGVVKTAPVPVKVISVGKKLTDKDDIRPIKGPVSMGLGGFWTGIKAALAAALFLFLVVKVVLRMIRERKDQEGRKPPHERVKIELARLKDRGFLEEKDYKSYYSGFSDILRRYLERRFGMEALERTSTEIFEDLERHSLEGGVREAVGEALSQSDLVKFAKLTPPYELAGRLEALLLDIAEKTKPVPEVRKK